MAPTKGPALNLYPNRRKKQDRLFNKAQDNLNCGFLSVVQPKIKNKL